MISCIAFQDVSFHLKMGTTVSICFRGFDDIVNANCLVGIIIIIIVLPFLISWSLYVWYSNKRHASKNLTKECDCRYFWYLYIGHDLLQFRTSNQFLYSMVFSDSCFQKRIKCNAEEGCRTSTSLPEANKIKSCARCQVAQHCSISGRSNYPQGGMLIRTFLKRNSCQHQ